MIELRSVRDCPNLALTRELLRARLAEACLPVEFTEMIGDYPSPSILIDGVDVMGDTGQGPACRLDPPTAAVLGPALQRAATQADDCNVVPMDVSGDPIRADRPDRAAALPDEARAVHQQILWHFSGTGTTPSPADIERVAQTAGVSAADALADLAAHDLIATDGGRLIAAYPFSPTPTAHRVRLGAVEVYAMCAIDALGMPFMLDTDATVSSLDPQSGEPVTVTVTAGQASFSPTTAVVVYAATGPSTRSVDTCCATINFFTSTLNAEAWIATRPHLSANVLDQQTAVVLGRDIFGLLLQAEIKSDSGALH